LAYAGPTAQHLPLDELSTVIARIQGLLLTEEKVTTAVRLLAQAAKESVPGTMGAGVSLLVDGRWAEWRHAIRQLPIRSVVSAPLLAGKEAIGALKLYAAAPHSYDGSSTKLLQLFAAPAATLLAHIQASEPHRR
jgi:transcriptional regulator with GAF, ATPase, and Fis domain